MNKRFEHISPLVFGAACVLLTLIISVFAFNNYRREKVLMLDSLVRQGETITRFIFSSTRSAVIRNMRMRHLNNENMVQDVQASLDQALDHPGINYIHVISSKGEILASTVESQIGSTLDHEMLHFFNKIHSLNGDDHIERLLDNKDDRKVFQYIQLRPFRLPSKELDAPPDADFRGRKGMRRDFDLFRENLSSMMQDEAVILIELDASPYEKVVRRQLIQIGALSLVLLLVGIGGWLSINTLQRLKGSQSQLKSVETFRNLLVGSLPVGIIAADEKNRLQVVNPAAEKLFSIVSKEVLSKSLDQVLPADLIYRIMQDTAGSEQSRINEFEYHLIEGQGDAKIYYIYSLSIIDETDSPKGRLLLVQDVSEMRALEKDLRKHERFAALGKVAAGVAHELRNPLSSIKGLAVLTGKKLENDERGRTSVNLMIKEVDRLDRSIRELLEFARPEKLNLEKYDFDKLVYEALEIFETDFSSRKIRVKTDVKAMIKVLADKDKIKQVFLNLFLNAIQAIDENGDIAIALYEEQGMAVCSVQDSGGGIPPDIIDKVFDPYFTTKNDGTGLGLAISVKIVEEHNGNLSISSDAQGTTVYLRLPVIS